MKTEETSVLPVGFPSPSPLPTAGESSSCTRTLCLSSLTHSWTCEAQLHIPSFGIVRLCEKSGIIKYLHISVKIY